MSTKDLQIHENGNGGELLIYKKDLATSESLFTLIYISLFGGNYDSSTSGNEPENLERFDFWGNDLVFKNQKDKQFNSVTEKALNETVLNSSGRLKIESAVKRDLNSLKNIIDLSVSVSILSSTEVSVKIKASRKGSKSESVFQFTWNNAIKQVINQEQI
jgi:hypothetical protein